MEMRLKHQTARFVFNSLLTPVAQLAEALVLETSECGFKSHQEYCRDVIQRPEALVWDQGVAGSNPAVPI